MLKTWRYDSVALSLGMGCCFEMGYHCNREVKSPAFRPTLLFFCSLIAVGDMIVFEVCLWPV